MRELHARENGHHVGVFSEDDEERISFAYDANEGLPISLSLPRTGGWRDQHRVTSSTIYCPTIRTSAVPCVST